MDIGHVPTPRIDGQSDDAAVDIARYVHPSEVQVTDGVVSDYSEFTEHSTQVLHDALIDLPDNDVTAVLGAAEALERLIGARRTDGAR